MELDDLKHAWKQANKIENPKNLNIMELIQNKNYGPVAQLKRSFKKQVIAMITVSIAIIANNIAHIEKTLSSALFWFYIIFCIGVIIVARLNYSVVKKIERMDGMVKSNLEHQIFILETRQKQKLIGIRVAMLFFIVLLEVLPYFQSFRMLNKWHSLSPFIRFAAYTVLFLFQYFMTGMVSRRGFARHIDYLKELVKQMQ
jgi:hypothetical protein